MSDDPVLRRLNRRMERRSAVTIIGWAVDTYGAGLCLTTSMTDAVLIDLATAIEPSIEVVFIDTGYHFPETLETLEAVRRRYRLNLRTITARDLATDQVMRGPDGCCSQTKVRQLDFALAGRRAWMSGLRRCDAPTRADAPIVARDQRGLIKVNPIARWTDDDVQQYIADHDVPVNPLLARGYPSIGCWPCTAPVAAGAHHRSGRWTGSDRTECGLHT